MEMSFQLFHLTIFNILDEIMIICFPFTFFCTPSTTINIIVITSRVQIFSPPTIFVGKGGEKKTTFKLMGFFLLNECDRVLTLWGKG